MKKLTAPLLSLAVLLAHPAFAKLAKVQFGVNNLFDRHSIVDVASAGTKTSSSAAPSPADLLTVLPARSVSLTLTVDF